MVHIQYTFYYFLANKKYPLFSILPVHFSRPSPKNSLSGNYLPTFSSSLTDIRALELTAAVSSWIRESGRFEQWAAGRLLTQHSSQDSLQDTLGQFNHLEILLLLFWVESERAAALSNKQPVAYSTLTAGLTRAIRPSWKTALAVELLFWVGSERAARLLWAAGCLHSIHCRRDTLGTGC